MNYADIFFSIIHETDFFNSFFYKQYLVDTKANIAYDIKSQKTYLLREFLDMQNISLQDSKSKEFMYSCADTIILRPKNHPHYHIVLTLNTTISYFKTSPTFLIPQEYEMISDHKTLTNLLYKTPQATIYILFFNFITNQDLTNPEIDTLIFSTIQSHFNNERCYYKKEDYNAYLLVLKDTTELDIYHHCLAICDELKELKKIFLRPQFFLIEYLPTVDFFIFIKKVKKHFYTLTFNEHTVIIKDKTL